MDVAVITAMISLAGSVIGTFSGIIAGSKLTSHRIEQLEKKVDKHNSLVERMYSVESRICFIEKQVKGGN